MAGGCGACQRSSTRRRRVHPGGAERRASRWLRHRGHLPPAGWCRAGAGRGPGRAGRPTPRGARRSATARRLCAGGWPAVRRPAGSPGSRRRCRPGWWERQPGLGLAADWAAPAAGLLDTRAGADRLVTHHEVPFFVAVEGFARVLAPAVLQAPPGRCPLGRRQGAQERDGGRSHWKLHRSASLGNWLKPVLACASMGARAGVVKAPRGERRTGARLVSSPVGRRSVGCGPRAESTA